MKKFIILVVLLSACNTLSLEQTINRLHEGEFQVNLEKCEITPASGIELTLTGKENDGRAYIEVSGEVEQPYEFHAPCADVVLKR